MNDTNISEVIKFTKNISHVKHSLAHGIVVMHDGTEYKIPSATSTVRRGILSKYDIEVYRDSRVYTFKHICSGTAIHFTAYIYPPL